MFSAPHSFLLGTPNTWILSDQFSSVIQSILTLCDPKFCSTPVPPCLSPTPRVYSNLCLLSWWGHPTISASVVPFSYCPQSFPASGSFQISQFFAKVLEFKLQNQSFQWIFSSDFLYDGLVGSPCNPRDSQESSPTPQFKSINSSMLSFLYSPTLASIYDYWKNNRQTFD